MTIYSSIAVSGLATAVTGIYAVNTETNLMAVLAFIFLMIFGGLWNWGSPYAASYSEASEKWESMPSTHEAACSLVMSGEPFLFYLRSFSGEMRHEEINSPAAGIPDGRLKEVIEGRFPTTKHVWYTQGIIKDLQTMTRLPIVQERNWADPNQEEPMDILTVDCGPDDWWDAFLFLAERSSEIVMYVHTLSEGVRKELAFLNKNRKAIKSTIVYDTTLTETDFSATFPELTFVITTDFVKKTESSSNAQKNDTRLSLPVDPMA